MPNQLILPVDPSSLPAGFCFQSFQQLLNDFSAHQSVTFPDTFTGIIISPTKPADTSKAWLKVDSLGRSVRLYAFGQGAWLSPHPEYPGMIKLWGAALPDFTTFDEGNSAALSPVSGPMWEEVTELRAKFPIGAGTLPSGKILSVGDTGGLEDVTLSEAQSGSNPSHTHTVGRFDSRGANSAAWLLTGASPLTAGAVQRTGAGDNVASGDISSLLGNPAAFAITSGVNITAEIAKHTNLPPFYTIYYLRKTQRIYYIVN